MASEPIDWLNEFRPLTYQHALVVLACVVVMVVVPMIAARIRRREERRERVIRKTLGWSTIAWQVWINLWWLQSGTGENNLPLHVCDIAAILSGVSLLTARARWATTLVYFWGLALSTQAFITPVLEAGMNSPAFWSFWVGHTQIVGIAIYHVAVLGYRPRVRDLGMITAINVGYVAAALVTNAMLNANYGYIGNTTPDKPTLIDALGPWPWRAVWLALIGNAACVAAWLPWAIMRRFNREDQP